MAGNGNFKFVGSVIAGVLAIVVIIFNLVYSPLTNAISKEADARATEDKALSADITEGDNTNRDDFLQAIKELTAEQKQDNKEISAKLEALATGLAVIKTEIKKR